MRTRGLTRSKEGFELSTTLRRRGISRIRMRFVLSFFFYCTYMFRIGSHGGMNEKNIPTYECSAFNISRGVLWWKEMPLYLLNFRV